MDFMDALFTLSPIYAYILLYVQLEAILNFKHNLKWSVLIILPKTGCGGSLKFTSHY